MNVSLAMWSSKRLRSDVMGREVGLRRIEFAHASFDFNLSKTWRKKVAMTSLVFSLFGAFGVKSLA